RGIGSNLRRGGPCPALYAPVERVAWTGAARRGVLRLVRPAGSRYSGSLVPLEKCTMIRALLSSPMLWWFAIAAPLSLSIAPAALPSARPRPGPRREPERARPARRGVLSMEANYELQTSSDGTEVAVPLAFEYGLTDRLELMAEPVPYTSIQPRDASTVSGVGDVEVTLSDLIHSESRHVPALALAGELKIPAAEAPLIGSDHYDWTTYLIGSKRFGSLDVHANVGYTVVGHPSDLHVNNTLDYALAAEYFVSRRWCVVAEVIGNTAAIPEAGSTESKVAPELSGG